MTGSLWIVPSFTDITGFYWVLPSLTNLRTDPNWKRSSDSSCLAISCSRTAVHLSTSNEKKNIKKKRKKKRGKKNVKDDAIKRRANDAIGSLPGGGGGQDHQHLVLDDVRQVDGAVLEHDRRPWLNKTRIKTKSNPEKPSNAQ